MMQKHEYSELGLAESLITDFLLKAHRYKLFERFDRKQASIATYAWQICSGVIGSYRKSKYRRMEIMGPDREFELENIEIDDGGFDLVRLRQDSDRFIAHLRKCNTQQCEVFSLIVQGKSKKDIALKLQLSMSQVYHCIYKLTDEWHEYNKSVDI